MIIRNPAGGGDVHELSSCINLTLVVAGCLKAEAHPKYTGVT